MAELLAAHLQAGAVGDGGAQEARERHAGNLDRCLEGEEDAGAGALVRAEVGHVLTIEGDGAGGLRVGGVAHDHVAERGLAGAVGAHEHMGLASGNGKVDAVENGLLVHGGGKPLNGEERGLGHGFSLL